MCVCHLDVVVLKYRNKHTRTATKSKTTTKPKAGSVFGEALSPCASATMVGGCLVGGARATSGSIVRIKKRKAN